MPTQVPGSHLSWAAKYRTCVVHGFPRCMSRSAPNRLRNRRVRTTHSSHSLRRVVTIYGTYILYYAKAKFHRPELRSPLSPPAAAMRLPINMYISLPYMEPALHQGVNHQSSSKPPPNLYKLLDHPRESFQRVHRFGRRHDPRRCTVGHGAAGRHWRGHRGLHLGLCHRGGRPRGARVRRLSTPFRRVLDLGVCVTLGD